MIKIVKRFIVNITINNSDISNGQQVNSFSLTHFNIDFIRFRVIIRNYLNVFRLTAKSIFTRKKLYLQEF